MRFYLFAKGLDVPHLPKWAFDAVLVCETGSPVKLVLRRALTAPSGLGVGVWEH